ncbi:hypothetical protein CLA_0856 [Campylobacter lari RM2100]|uniref:Uncharacterized protein n=1 Tax=Campylobacter lari (strain RM2100 / D67 / ATCC BAA-1060) TaxID=306263 RepID=B9KC93_CAMLR|nr:hypothetical protein CLA_0856 [Campylobacter lari RM2100]
MINLHDKFFFIWVFLQNLTKLSFYIVIKKIVFYTKLHSSCAKQNNLGFVFFKKNINSFSKASKFLINNLFLKFFFTLSFSHKKHHKQKQQSYKSKWLIRVKKHSNTFFCFHSS